MHLTYRQLRSRYNNPNRGDTIVEVLICIAIVGAVISGAYSLAGNSLQQGISASEHTQAIKIAEGQVEALKYRQRVSTASVWSNFTAAQNFCLNTAAPNASDTNWLPKQNNFTAISPVTSLARKGATTFGYDSACTNPSTGNAKYFINITTPSAASSNPTYLVTVRWTPPGNGPVSQTSLYHKVFP